MRYDILIKMKIPSMQLNVKKVRQSTLSLKDGSDIKFTLEFHWQTNG